MYTVRIQRHLFSAIAPSGTVKYLALVNLMFPALANFNLEDSETTSVAAFSF